MSSLCKLIFNNVHVHAHLNKSIKILHYSELETPFIQIFSQVKGLSIKNNALINCKYKKKSDITFLMLVLYILC